MRRRLLRQRQVREALLLDLGALVFELNRQGRREPELLQAKAGELAAVDDEVRALSHALDAQDTVLELTAGGIAGDCSRCGALMPLEARYCANCGVSAQVALGAAPVGRRAPQLATEQNEPSATATQERPAMEAGDSARAQPGPPAVGGDQTLGEGRDPAQGSEQAQIAASDETPPAEHEPPETEAGPAPVPDAAAGATENPGSRRD